MDWFLLFGVTFSKGPLCQVYHRKINSSLSVFIHCHARPRLDRFPTAPSSMAAQAALRFSTFEVTKQVFFKSKLSLGLVNLKPIVDNREPLSLTLSSMYTVVPARLNMCSCLIMSFRTRRSIIIAVLTSGCHLVPLHPLARALDIH